MANSVEEILDFWFGELDAAGLCATDHNSLWFGAKEQTDETCRIRFDADLALALRGNLDSWAHTDSGLIALVVLLDQLSRNIHRGTARAFAGDARALALAQRAIANGHHRRLPIIHQVFLYLPLEHCEDIAVQHECVTLFEVLAAVTGTEQFASFARYALAHQEVIAKFGRFPHRNALLGRKSSARELAFLEQHRGF